MSTVIRGQQSLVQGTVTSTSKLGTSGRTTYTYKGAQQEVVNKANELYAQGWDTEIQTGPIWTLTATYGADIIRNPNAPQEEPRPDWDVQVTQFQKFLFESDAPAIKQLTHQTRKLIEDKLKNPLSSIPIVEWEKLGNGNEAYIENAIKVYKLMGSGVDSALDSYTEVSRTINVPRGYNLNWSQVNNGKVLTKPYLVSVHNVPNDIAALLPTASDVEEEFGKCVFGYLEQGTKYRIASGNSVQISQHWIYNKWCTLMYEVAG